MTRPRTRMILVALAVVVIAAGAAIGVLVGRSIADANTTRDERAGDRASREEDAARERRDLLETRLRYLERQTRTLPKIGVKAPLLASAKATTDVEPGTTFRVDGGEYRLRGIQVVDEFTSQEPQRPATKRDGWRWLLVDVDYTNRTREYQAPACGTNGTIHAILEDGTSIPEVDHRPPIHPDTYAKCGDNLAPGRGGRWLAPVLVPEGAKLAGILVADVYARGTDSPYRVQGGTAAWLRFDDEIDVGSTGDDSVEARFEGKDA